MNLVRFLSYPVYFNPASERASAYVMEHFYRIRSNTRSRQLLKFLVRPVIPFSRRWGRDRLVDHLRFERLRPYLEGREFEAVIDARRFFRLIDFNRREVINIFKADDLPVYFQNEIAARERLSGADFIPRLIAVDEANKVFTEEYDCVRPFKSVRLGSLDVDDFVVRIKEILCQVRKATAVRVVPADEYIGAISEQILRRPEADGEIRRYVSRLRDKALGLGEVELVFSHGDFRKDQIFFARDESVRIIDWECSGCFSRYYDPAELYLTERWLYSNPALSPEFLLEPGSAPLAGVFSLYLLELCSFPIRFHREFLLTHSVPIVKQVERRIRKHVFDWK